MTALVELCSARLHVLETPERGGYLLTHLITGRAALDDLRMASALMFERLWGGNGCSESYSRVHLPPKAFQTIRLTGAAAASSDEVTCNTGGNSSQLGLNHAATGSTNVTVPNGQRMAPMFEFHKPGQAQRTSAIPAP